MKTADLNLSRILQQHKLWLETNYHEGARADLRGAYLRGANLWQANLREAYLREAYLQSANLWGADLREANLRGADLQRADLRGADLRDADLRRAYLWDADLWGAQLDVNIRHCYSFNFARFTPDALPWLILHPHWTKWKDNVTIEGMSPDEVNNYKQDDARTFTEARIRRAVRHALINR